VSRTDPNPLFRRAAVVGIGSTDYTKRSGRTEWALAVEAITHALASGRRAYVHVIQGEALANGQPLGPGDALKSQGEREVRVEGTRAAEILLFDLP